MAMERRNGIGVGEDHDGTGAKGPEHNRGDEAGWIGTLGILDGRQYVGAGQLVYRRWVA